MDVHLGSRNALKQVTETRAKYQPALFPVLTHAVRNSARGET